MQTKDDAIKSILKRNRIDQSVSVVAFTSGQVNEVFKIGRELVLKVEKDLDVVSHQSELIERAFKVGAMVPEVLDVGKTDYGDYLLMRLVPGRTVAKDWFDFSKVTQEVLMEQLAEQLQILHSISFNKYASQRPKEYGSWREALREYTDFNGINLNAFDKETQRNFDTVKSFYFEHETLLDDAEAPVLVHNDVHFENMLHVDGKLTGLIDFDFARQAPKDYELWHIVDFFQRPKHYVDEPLEVAWERFILTDELKWLRNYYPALFSTTELATRQRLYQIENIASTIRDGAVKKFNEKVEVYFKGDWLERALS